MKTLITQLFGNTVPTLLLRESVYTHLHKKNVFTQVTQDPSWLQLLNMDCIENIGLFFLLFNCSLVDYAENMLVCEDVTQ
jgi:hypothetical protein